MEAYGDIYDPYGEWHKFISFAITVVVVVALVARLVLWVVRLFV